VTASASSAWDEQVSDFVSGPSDETGPVVRPYAITGGRTRPEHSYPLEALVRTRPGGERSDSTRTPEVAAICALCRSSRSVAEVAANLGVPLGVARVLIGDMVGEGLIVVHEPTTDAPEAHLLERVLSGLRRL
jgi:Protein of unknown function (DUF742)